MTEWRHIDYGDPEGECLAGVSYTSSAAQWLGSCGCLDLTPDPASPCGYIVDSDVVPPRRCGETADGHNAVSPHVPTRCTCGHSIEAINPGPAASGSEGGSDHG